MAGSQIAVTIARALAGWALCGATLGIGLAATTLSRSLIIHAAAAPVIFGIVSFFYFRYFAYRTPLATALIFVGVVVAMDFFVAALLIQHNLAVVRSILGTWLPFALIFAATYATGRIVRTKSPI